MLLSHDIVNGHDRISDIKFETLGDVAIADNMTYIDNGVVFIGSKFGDSQLIKVCVFFFCNQYKLKLLNNEN